METKAIKPCYKIGLIPEKYSTNKDTPFKITIAASGGGHIEKAKIMVYSDEQVKIKIDEGGEWSNVFIEIRPEVFEEDRSKGGYYNIFPLKSEFTDKIRTIQIKSDSTGDHSIFFVLSYTPDNENWYSDRTEFKFHVNTILDNNQLWLSILAVLVAIIALIITAVASLYDPSNLGDMVRFAIRSP